MCFAYKNTLKTRNKKETNQDLPLNIVLSIFDEN